MCSFCGVVSNLVLCFSTEEREPEPSRPRRLSLEGPPAVLPRPSRPGRPVPQPVRVPSSSRHKVQWVPGGRAAGRPHGAPGHTGAHRPSLCAFPRESAVLRDRDPPYTLHAEGALPRRPQALRTSVFHHRAHAPEPSVQDDLGREGTARLRPGGGFPSWSRHTVWVPVARLPLGV